MCLPTLPSWLEVMKKLLRADCSVSMWEVASTPLHTENSKESTLLKASKFFPLNQWHGLGMHRCLLPNLSFAIFRL